MWEDDEDQEQEGVIPGDNDKERSDSEPPYPNGVNPDLTRIPAQGGDIPVVRPPVTPPLPH